MSVWRERPLHHGRARRRSHSEYLLRCPSCLCDPSAALGSRVCVKVLTMMASMLTLATSQLSFMGNGTGRLVQGLP